MSTYEMTRWIYASAEIESRLQESGGEISPEMDQMLQVIDMRLPASIDNAKLLLDRLTSVSQEYRERAAQCSKVARGVSEVVERMKMSVKTLSVLVGTKEFLGNTYRMVVSSAKPRMEINADLLPDSWKLPEVTLVPDKEKIRQALEAGQEIPGAKLIESYSIRTYYAKR